MLIPLMIGLFWLLSLLIFFAVIDRPIEYYTKHKSKTIKLLFTAPFIIIGFICTGIFLLLKAKLLG